MQPFDSLCSNSTCENYVAIIVGSMPAFASFFNGEMPGASWVAGLHSLILSLRHGASSSKIRLSGRSNAGSPSCGKSTVPNGHARDRGYLELDDTRYLGNYELGSVETGIRGEDASPGTIEEGAIYKTVAVQQSMRQVRLTV